MEYKNDPNSLDGDDENMGPETPALVDSGAPLFGTSQEVVLQYSHCGFCDAHLHFTHITDFANNLTQENCKCPECGQKKRPMLHRLQ